MKSIYYIIVNIVETLLRVLPFPCRRGLIKVGNPGRDSPVFLTGNFHLTVERVKRSLRGMDAYLLVANSHGINVWCGATGGHFTNHDVISILKTSGIEDLVDHRKVVLPQLAASGIEARMVQKRAGWKVIWGPVYARDISLFMENSYSKTAAMRVVNFSWTQRVEMAVAWAFPISVVLTLFLLPLWRQAILDLNLLVWGMALLIFMLFPFYNHLLVSGKRRYGLIFFDIGRGFYLVLWIVFLAGLVTYSILSGKFGWKFILPWSITSFVAILMLSIDIMGSTPIYKSGLLEGSDLKIVINKERCRGVGVCEQVCPRNCYEVAQIKTMMPRVESCVRCGACIVQCPLNALSFESPNGEMIPPETVRKFKLNFMGKRSVQRS